jgi:hypothetical protein
MKKLLAVAALFAFTATPALAGEIFAGTWNGETHTSIEIISAKKVRYCFHTECNIMRPKGSPSEMIFTWPKKGAWPGAKMTIVKQGDVYIGKYAENGASEVFEATFVKQ